MKTTMQLAAVLPVLVAFPLRAQSPQCPGGSPGSAAQITQDACQQSIDLFQYLAPQLGTAIAGGNATLGQGGTLGGLGHFSVGVRANAVAGSIPQVQSLQPRTTGASPARQFPVKDRPIPMPAADAAIGIFKGIPLPLTNVGGVDLLLSASYIPQLNQDNVSVDADTPLKLGYGVRLGALQESLLVPGISVTYLRRDLPKLTVTAGAGGDSLSVSGLDLETTAWRLVASKSLILFGVAGGIGRDTYKSSANVQGSVPTVLGRQRSGVIQQAQTVTRATLFLDMSVNLPLLKLVGEIGQTSGGTISTYNGFGGKPADASRLYGSIGLRFGW